MIPSRDALHEESVPRETAFFRAVFGGCGPARQAESQR